MLEILKNIIPKLNWELVFNYKYLWVVNILQVLFEMD